MMSAYMCEFVSYNVLDSDYVKENKPIELEEIKTEIKEEEEEILPNEGIEIEPKFPEVKLDSEPWYYFLQFS